MLLGVAKFLDQYRVEQFSFNAIFSFSVANE